jgi:poly(hydroxyalkanoate) depolymerase family esterase
MVDGNRVRGDAHLPAGTTPGPNGIARRPRARRRIARTLLVTAAMALLPGAATASAASITSADYSGPEGSQHYELFVPSSYNAGTPMPLVVALHGCTQTADQFRLLTRWDAVAEAKGFILLLPEQSSSNNTFKCWNFFQDSSMHRSAGDPARIAAVTSLIENTYNVDPHRVYVTGLSSGGAMASVMAATYSDYYAAIGIGSGCEYAATAACAGYRSADPTQAGQAAYKEMGPRARPIPFIVFQGDQDTAVPPANADQLVQQWLVTDDLADDGVANGSVGTSPAKSSFGFSQGGRSYTLRTYDDAQKAELGQYWLIRGMKHAWSGGDGSQPFSDPSGPDATAAMYAFFEAHPAPGLARPAPPLPPGGSAASKPAAASAPKATGPAAATPAASKRAPRAPMVSRPRLFRGRIVFLISGPGSVTLRFQQRVAGHLKNRMCVPGKRTRGACSRYKTRAKIVRGVARAGVVAIRLPTKVPAGRYRLKVTPADNAGHTGISRTLALAMR